ncbi:MAG: AMP-binding protein [Desulfobulbaceae bacterium]|nr:AMP-binding protein [Desulfobulbaceae bacterium]
MQTPSNESHTASDQQTEKLLSLIEEMAHSLHPGQKPAPINLDTSIDRDLGLDSLSRVELLARIERLFDLTLPEQLLATADTPRDFLRAMAVSGTGVKHSLHPAAEALARVEDQPLNAQTLIEVLEWHAARHPERPHIRLYSDSDEGEIITYGQLRHEAQKLASGLQQSGLSPGETTLLMLPTGREYFISFFAVLIAGGVPVPLYPPGRIKQIEEHLRRHTAIANNCTARFMITIPEAQPFTRLMHTQVPSLRKIVTVGAVADFTSDTPFQQPFRTAEDVAFLQYTSGSTGQPKGVILNHANILANIRAMGRVTSVTSEDVFISWLPLYHDMGLIGAWFGSLYHACQLVILSPLAFIARPARWLRAIHRFGGTISAAPNFAYELCLRRIDQDDLTGIDLSSWRCAFNGAEAVSPSVINGFIERFSAYGFSRQAMMPVYGLAESSVGLAFPPLGRGPLIDRIRRRPLIEAGRAEPADAAEVNTMSMISCGLPLSGHEIRIIDSQGREMPDRQEGHLQFKGPSVTSGYFRNPVQTASLFQGSWLNSGDRAYIADGEVYITGRSKDIIIRAGRNIYPEELEEAVGQIDGIRQGNVAVFGSVRDDSSLERLVVLAETRARKEETLKKLRLLISNTIADICGSPPDEVVLAPPNTVLKTSSGKIRRASSRELYEKGHIGRAQRAVWLQIALFAISGIPPRLFHLTEQLKATAYAIVCWLLFGAIALIVWTGAMLIPSRLRRWRFIHRAARLLLKLTGIPLQVENQEHLSRLQQPCIFVANHASYLDGILLAAILPEGASFIAKAELQNHCIFRTFLNRLGTQFVERFDWKKGSRDARSLIEKARAGQSLFYFAEGTFSRIPGLLPFRLGAFETAIHAGLPIIPIIIRGSRSILRADSWFPRHGVVRIIIGPSYPAVTLPAGHDEERWQAAVTLKDQVRSWMLAHCGEPDLAGERPAIFEKIK